MPRLFLTLAFFTWLMARITVDYIPYNTDVGFLRIKQHYIHIDHWRIAFFIHVYASIWVLLAGFTQFSKQISAKQPAAAPEHGIYLCNGCIADHRSGRVADGFLCQWRDCHQELHLYHWPPSGYFLLPWHSLKQDKKISKLTVVI